MTIFDLVLYIAIAALALTLLTGFVFKSHKSWIMTFLQNFCGSLFIFSGYVKAVDPLGTAFKMEQYFSEFFYTFKDTAFSFIAPIFPWFSEHSVTFSVVMIVFEIVLGAALLLGSRAKITAWLFLLLVAFFTVLTGFTFLTGYVPADANFFEFGKWGAYLETNMRVTDCGCFGDFLKLKPEMSFYKDLFLLIPSIYFVFKHKDMHQLFTARVRTIILWVVTLGFLVFCIRNISWDEPIFDFRPFKAGTDVRAQKAAEEEAQANVKITHYKMTNKATGQVVTIPMEQYMKEFANYPKEEWNLEQIKTKPEIEPTKISDFDVSDAEGVSVTEDILGDPNYSFMIVAYKIKQLDGSKTMTTTISDTTFVVDTVRMEGTDSFTLVKKVDKVTPREVQEEAAIFDPGYEAVYKNKVNPVMEAAQKAGYKVFAVTKPNDPAIIDDFRHATQSAYPFYTADDLLLKTIQRSNPGVVLWKDGKIVAKWHHKKLPSFEQIQNTYLK
jgi:uncharacterized membrane protein YphA (DoxX/SURF4 family)